MVVYAEQKPRTVTGAESEFDRTENAIPRPEIRINQSNKGSNSAIAYLIAAIVLVVGAYLLYTNNWSPGVTAPSVTQNNTTLPTPDVIVPDPATPPVAEKTAPPATVPVAPVQYFFYHLKHHSYEKASARGGFFVGQKTREHFSDRASN